MTSFTESIVEEAALAWLAKLGWTVTPGPAMAPGEPAAERTGYGEVVLAGRLGHALRRLNPGLPTRLWRKRCARCTARRRRRWSPTTVPGTACARAA